MAIPRDPPSLVSGMRMVGDTPALYLLSLHDSCHLRISLFLLDEKTQLDQVEKLHRVLSRQKTRKIRKE